MKKLKKSSLYTTSHSSLWSGRSGERSGDKIFHLIQLLDLSHHGIEPFENTSAVLLGLNSDEGVRRNQGRIGATEGPSQLRAKLSNGSLQGDKGKTIYDAGNINVIDEKLEEAQEELGKRVKQIIDRGGISFVLGGGHETSWGHYLGLVEKYGHDLAILNFDAHFDLRSLSESHGQGSSGTPFFQIANEQKKRGHDFCYYVAGVSSFSNSPTLFKRADHLGVSYLLDHECDNENKVLEFIKKVLEKKKFIYVSICLDVFSSCYAPGVSAPASIGILPHKIIKALNIIGQSKKLVAMDIVELNPKYDIDERTAKLGATLLGILLSALE